VELWNKIDNMGGEEAAEEARLEAACVPVDVDAVVMAVAEEAEEEDERKELPTVAGHARIGGVEGEEEDDGGYVAALPDGGFDTVTTLAHGDDSSAHAPADPPTPTPKRSRKSPASRTVTRAPRKTFTVAASVKTGLGFDDFLGALEAALSLRLKVRVRVIYVPTMMMLWWY